MFNYFLPFGSWAYRLYGNARILARRIAKRVRERCGRGVTSAMVKQHYRLMLLFPHGRVAACESSDSSLACVHEGQATACGWDISLPAQCICSSHHSNVWVLWGNRYKLLSKMTSYLESKIMLGIIQKRTAQRLSQKIGVFQGWWWSSSRDDKVLMSWHAEQTILVYPTRYKLFRSRWSTEPQRMSQVSRFRTSDE